MKKRLVHTVLLGCALTSASWAQNSDIEEVNVIGIRQAYQGDFEPLETPQAELKIDARTLKNWGAVDLSDALDLSASVARQNNFGGLWNAFAIRGFAGDENLPSTYLVNGFNAGRGFGGPRDLSGIESVEVLKGPRAALFGRGEPGGTINLVTKRPTFEQEGEISLSLGSFNLYRTDVDYTTPLSDSVAVRLVGFYEDADSFRDTVETKKQGLSPSITWKINNQSQLTYEMEYSDQEIPFDRGVVAVNGNLNVIPRSRFLGEPGDGPMKAEVLGHQIEYQTDINENWSALLGFNYRDTSLEGASTENGFFDRRQFLNLDGESLTRFRRFRDYDAAYHVFRAELSGLFTTGNIEHRLIMGVDADEFENDQIFFRIRGSNINPNAALEDELVNLRETNQLINIFNPQYGAYPLPPFTQDTINFDQVEKQETVGFYVQDHITLSNAIDIRIGVRFDDFSQQLDGDSTLDETQISPQFGIVYKVTDSVSLYAVYGENFRPLSGTGPDGDNFDPNDSKSTELGVNFELNDGSLTGTVAIFDLEQGNILGVTDPDSFQPIAIGAASGRGLEFDLVGNITDDLNLWLSYAYIDAETEREFRDPNFAEIVPAGSPLVNIPEHSLSVQLVHTKEFLEFGGGLLYVGDRNGFFGNDFELPSYITVRAFAEYEVSDSFALRLDIDNLFDEPYYPNSFADVWVQPGAPTNATLTGTYRF